MKRAIVLFGHGARDPEWAIPFVNVQTRLRQARPTMEIELAFLEFMQPNLATAVSALATRGASDLTIVPLFLAQGGHLKHDLPRIVERIRAVHPALTIDVTSPIGDVDAVLDAITHWILSATKP
jgi:sirohydrochlorin cobaltochelatase